MSTLLVKASAVAMSVWGSPRKKSLRSLVGLALCFTLAVGRAEAESLMIASNETQLLRIDGQTGQVLSSSDRCTAGDIVVGIKGTILVAHPPASEISEFDLKTGEYLGRFGGTYNYCDPIGLAVGPDGTVFASLGSADLNEPCSIIKFDGQTGQRLGTFVTTTAEFDIWTDIVFGPNGNLFGTTGGNTELVMQWDGTTGDSLGVFTKNSPYGVCGPNIVFGPDGDLYTASRYMNSVLRYDGVTGEFKSYFAHGFVLDHPVGLAFGPDGNLYVGNYGTEQILRYNGSTGAFMDVFADGVGTVGNITFAEIAVPEPSSLFMSLVAFGSIAGFRRWRKGAKVDPSPGHRR